MAELPTLGGMASKLNLTLVQGKTFSKVLRYGAPPFLYKPITGITRAAPARLTVTGHAIPDGWRVAPVSVLGMTEINAANTPPKAKDYLRATVIDVNTIELNTVNSAEFTAYASGGYLQLYTPVDLTGAIVRTVIKNKVGGDTLVTLTSVASAGVTLDNTAKTITLGMSADDIDALDWTRAIHETEIEISGVIKLLAEGAVTVKQE